MARDTADFQWNIKLKIDEDFKVYNKWRVFWVEHSKKNSNA